jgi:hypothetical protein
MTDATEGAHLGHPDFRAGGRISATLHADSRHGMVKITLEQQQRFVESHPGAFTPESGAWGRQGCTRVRLDAVDEDTLGEALSLARRLTFRRICTCRNPSRVVVIWTGSRTVRGLMSFRPGTPILAAS